MRHTRMQWKQRIGAATLFLAGVLLVTMDIGISLAAAKNKPRFTISSNDPSWVLDRTTSLEWYISGSAWGSSTSDLSTQDCTLLGNGARFPEINELISLVDYSVAYPGPLLPAGAPFINVQANYYWSATPAVGDRTLPGSHWLLDLTAGVMYSPPQVSSGWVWCVR